MARFVRGTTIAPTTLVTAATLHTLIEAATITNLTGSDITGSVYFPGNTAATPSPSESPFWYDPSQEDPIFRVFAAPWNIWVAFGPDRFELPFRNASSTDALKGALVVASGSSSFGLASNPSLNVLGFLQSTTPAGSYGPVCTMGIGWALWASGHSGMTDADTSRIAISRGTPLGTVTSLEAFGNNGSGPMFGMFLEGDRSGFSGSYSTKRIFIWGPKLTTGF